LWGQNKGTGFLSKSVVLALYKDMYAVGYCKLKEQIANWYSPTEKTLSHNTQVIF
jgi:hypothetical protein